MVASIKTNNVKSIQDIGCLGIRLKWLLAYSAGTRLVAKFAQFLFAGFATKWRHHQIMANRA